MFCQCSMDIPAPDSTGLRNGGLLGSNRFQLVTCWREGAGSHTQCEIAMDCHRIPGE